VAFNDINLDPKKDPAQFIPADIPELKPTSKKKAEKYVKRVRPECEAGSVTNDWVLTKEPYRTGDGDILSFRRIGSDHSHIKSFGVKC